MIRLRRAVASLMTEAHRIPQELALDHVEHMDNVEVWERFMMYARRGLHAGTELSAPTVSGPALCTESLGKESLEYIGPTEHAVA